MTPAPSTVSPKARSAIASKTKTVNIDKRAQTIVQGVSAGDIPDHEARWEIAALVLESNVINEVTQAIPSSREQYELRLLLTEFLESKIIEPGNNGFDFKLAAGASLCGWARKMTFAAMASKRRDFRYGESRMIPVSPIMDANRVSTGQAIDFQYHNYRTPDYDQHTEEVVSRYEEKAKNARGVKVLHVRAQALSEGFGIPTCVRSADYLERRQLAELLEGDEELGFDSASEYLRHVYSLDLDGNMVADTPSPVMTDVRLLNLWESFKKDDLEELVSKSPVVAHTLALAAVSDMPRPKKALQIDMHRNLALAGKGKGWKTLIVALVESFVALECQTASDWHSPSEQRLTEMEAARTIAQRNWIDRAAKVSEWKGTPLGGTPAAVHAACFKMLNAIMSATGESFSMPSETA